MASHTGEQLGAVATRAAAAKVRPGVGRGEEAVEAALVLADMVLVWIGAAIALYLRFAPALKSASPVAPPALTPDMVSQHVGVFLLYSLFVVLFCYHRALYRRVQTSPLLAELFSVVQAVTIATVVLTAFIYLGGAVIVSRFAVLVTVVLTYCELVGWRIARRKWVEAQFKAGIATRNVLIVGSGTVGRAIEHYIQGQHSLGLVVAGFLAVDRSDESGSETALASECLGGIDDFQRIARRSFIDEVFITVPEKRDLVKRIAVDARALGINVRVVPELYDGLAWGAPIQQFGLFPTIELHQAPAPMLTKAIKRAFDVVASAAGLLVLSPMLALVALAVRMTSPGPILYRSPRIGRKGRSFTCYKFRTMVNNAEVLKESLNHLNERQGLLFKVRNDPRVTPVGRFLRKYSLDEFPQLWNVLKGDMSLVGPRPPVPGEYTEYELEHLSRLDVTPGITGLWQVEARQDPSFENYINLDREYIERWSLALDFKILLKTALVVVAGTGW